MQGHLQHTTYGDPQTAGHHYNKGITMIKARLKYRMNNDREVLIDYLKESIKKGKLFFNSRDIAHDLGMTPKVGGSNMKILASLYQSLKIERWSYSKSTTWYVAFNNPS
jgi:hypothetical protein